MILAAAAMLHLALSAPAPKSKARSTSSGVVSGSILGDLSSSPAASASIQSRSGTGGRFAPSNNFNSGNSYSRWDHFLCLIQVEQQ